MIEIDEARSIEKESRTKISKMKNNGLALKIKRRAQI